MDETKKVGGQKNDTSTKRQDKYLKALEDAKGRRLVVDLDATARRSLETLLKSGYGRKQRYVVARALNEAAARLTQE